MNAVGLIVEYNPFHNGHKWHIEKAKQETGCKYVIGVMSGNFVQRGEPAIFDKWKRAEMAVTAGVDLIIELPTVFAVRSAQFFAEGAVRLLSSLGLVTHLCFGAECSDLETLNTLAHVSSSEQTIEKMQLLMKNGISYASALAAVIEQQCAIPLESIAAPNNILAIEYLKALKKYDLQITPVPIRRRHANYHDTEINAPYASATAIRREITAKLAITTDAGQAMSQETAQIAHQCLKEGRGPVTYSALEKLILARVRLLDLAELATLPDVAEGLHYKISEAALRAVNIQQFLTMIKSRRYPYTRLQRIIIHALIGTTQTDLYTFDQTGPLYARVLAFNENGRYMLKKMTETATIPKIIKTSVRLNSKQRSSGNLSPLERMLAIDTLASDIYVLGMPNPNLSYGGWDFRLSPQYIPHC
ncbi:hypothetical protein SDC9_63531 [bioreactor metagenome]|uniref:tRNA(Met) cytidine acetate ligase n=1 Tax=bioreactor metagenome TaxID=1076179 RepID=A0A644XLR6_9ZZZZ